MWVYNASCISILNILLDGQGLKWYSSCKPVICFKISSYAHGNNKGYILGSQRVSASASTSEVYFVLF